MKESFSPHPSIEALPLKDRLRRFLRPAVLAMALGSSSLVSIGCDGETEKPTIKSGQDQSQVESSSNPRSSRSLERQHQRGQEEAKRREEVKRNEDRVLRLAVEKKIISEEDLRGTVRHRIKYVTVGNVVVEATVDDISVPIERQDLSEDDIKKLQFVVNLNNDNSHTTSILEGLGISRNN
ncbi:MAG: hypothetical protein HQ402_03380 [Parcubacteria group bacterium]|nr:hypothetical protein [Parcubacteria group bacterium]